MTQSRHRCFIAGVAVIGLWFSGCVSLGGIQETCGWVEVVADGVEPGASRLLAGYSTDACGSVGEYVLHRPAYALEFWNGSGLGAQLFVRVRSHDGTRLQIEPGVFGEIDSRVASLSDARMSTYTHVFTASRLADGNAPPSRLVLRFTVLGSDGNVVATESVPVLIKFGKFRYRDGV